MTSSMQEKEMMRAGAALCPPQAHAFVGGLGLGVVILALAERCRRITVAEIDARVIRVVKPRLQRYLAHHYPDVMLDIRHGDALELIGQGRYDFVYMDIWPTADEFSREILERARQAAVAAQPQAKIVCWAEELIKGTGKW